MHAVLLTSIILSATGSDPAVLAARAGIAPSTIATTESGRLIVGTSQAGIYLSDDRGSTFAPAQSSPRLEDGSFARVAGIQPVPGAVLAAGEFGRVFRSDDNGNRWIRSDEGLPVPNVFRLDSLPLVVDPGDASTIYTLLSRPMHTRKVETYLYRSVDGGRNWSALKEVAGDASDLTLTVRRLSGHPLVEVRGPGTDLAFVDTIVRDLPPATFWRQPETPARRAQGGQSELITPADVDYDLDGDSISDLAVLHDDGTLVSVNDLANLFAPVHPATTIRFDRDGAPGLYRARLPVPTGPIVATGTALNIVENTPQAYTLPFNFEFFGVTYMGGTDQISISEDGYITFVTGFWPVQTSSQPFENAFDLQSGPPRIAAMWDDYNPANGSAPCGGAGSGDVFVDEATRPGCLIITWNDLAECGFAPGPTNSNKFQLVMCNNASFEITWESLTMPDGLVGISPGDADGPCAPPPAPCGGPLPSPALNYADWSVDAPFQLRANEATYEWFSNEFFTDRVARQFLHCHPDNYDQLVVWGASSYPYSVAGDEFALAFVNLLFNDVDGIGLDFPCTGACDQRARHGTNRIGAVNVMGHLGDYFNGATSAPWLPTEPNFSCEFTVMDVLAQQTARQWAAYTLFQDPITLMPSDEMLGRVRSHWSFFMQSEASVMEGNAWQMTNPGEFDVVGAAVGYSSLDLYLMGLGDSTAVADFFLITNPGSSIGCTGDCGLNGCTALQPCAEDSPPELSVCVPGTQLDVTVANVINQNGARMPATEPRTLAQAWILVVPPGGTTPPVTDPDVLHVESYRDFWKNTHYAAITGGAGFIDSDLTFVPAPAVAIGNTVRAAHQLNLNAVMTWRARAAQNPRRYVIHGTDDKTLLVDTPLGIASTPALDFTGVEQWVDRFSVPLGIAPPNGRPSPFFWEVHFRDCSQMTVFP